MPATWRGGRRRGAERHTDRGGEGEQDGGHAEVCLTHLTGAFNDKTCVSDCGGDKVTERTESDFFRFVTK